MKVLNDWKKSSYCMTVIYMIKDKGVANFKGVYDKKALYNTGDMFVYVRGKNDYESYLCLDSTRCIKLSDFRAYVKECTDFYLKGEWQFLPKAKDFWVSLPNFL